MTSASSSPALSSIELVLRWANVISESTLAEWRVSGRGPAAEERDGRRVYPLAAVQAYELAQSSIPRGVAWRGRFLSPAQLLARWRGGPLEVGPRRLQRWRSSPEKRRGPPFVRVHVSGMLFPLEALESWERTRLHELGHRLPPGALP